MAKVITLSRHFMKGHPKAGQPTQFVEKVLKSLGVVLEKTGIYKGCTFANRQDMRDINSKEVYYKTCDLIRCLIDFDIIAPKHHTIRGGKRWKTGDKASLRVWSGKPYNSPQIAIAPDVELVVKDVEINFMGEITIDGKFYPHSEILAHYDGLAEKDFDAWFAKSLPFSGQLLIWNNNTLPY